MNNLIEIENLSKNYFKKTALKNITLSIAPGKIYGLLGPNGSGKTTLMKVLAGLHKQSSGNVLINDQKIGSKTKNFVAFMPTEDFLYAWMNIKQTIHFYNDLYNDFDTKVAEELLEYMNLTEDMKVSSLSTGMKACLKILLTLSRNTLIYIFDEPLNGIDLIFREKILNTIVTHCNESKTIILSSHLVHEMETIVDTVIFIKNGEIALTGEAETFRREKQLSIEGMYKEVFA